jgi:hypothetical protein
VNHAAKHVVSVSLGSSARDVDVTVELLGETVRIQRRGTDGSVAGARALVAELDGQVDAIGLGGLDLFLQWMGRRYYFREARVIAAAAKRTPVVCGAGLKDTLERRAVALLDRSVGWRGRRVLLTVAVDRFGMAEALVAHHADVRFGDLMFALGLPWPIHSMRTLDRVARTLAPPLTKLPIAWLYPDGQQAEQGDDVAALRRALRLGRGRRRRLAHDPALRAGAPRRADDLHQHDHQGRRRLPGRGRRGAAGDDDTALRGPLAGHQPARGRVRGAARSRPGAGGVRRDPRRARLRPDRGAAVVSAARRGSWTGRMLDSRIAPRGAALACPATLRRQPAAPRRWGPEPTHPSEDLA